MGYQEPAEPSLTPSLPFELRINLTYLQYGVLLEVADALSASEDPVVTLRLPRDRLTDTDDTTSDAGECSQRDLKQFLQRDDHAK